MTIDSAPSATPESDSAGNKINSKHDFETMTSFDDYEDFQDDGEDSCLSYDFELFQASLSQLPMSRQKKWRKTFVISL